MIKTVTVTDLEKLPALISREADSEAKVDEVVAKIIADVRKNGDKAVNAYTKKFDGAKLSVSELTDAEKSEAMLLADEDFIQILREAAANIRAFHERQKREGFIISDKPGIVLGQKITPLERVGVYVPGGTASYPSTVLMDVIPAKLAGVSEIIMVTPPDKDGRLSPDIIAAAQVAGVDRIFKMGGAQAVAALAYGTGSVPKVDKIVGPGNIYVATAKRMVYGLVDIDMIAGPSEILIIADSSADADYVAIDMLSQAEHDRLAAATLVTTSKKLAKEVAERLDYYLVQLPRRDIAAHSITNNGSIIITDTLDKAVEISNYIAPEHLEVCTREPFALLSKIKNAGSIFLGHYAPEALGDYFAGPNHTLPTSGTARFSSPLSVDDFVKKSSFIYYEKEAIKAQSEKIAAFARREGLEAHARSALIRTQKEKGDKK